MAASKWQDDMPERAEELCRTHGFTQKELAVAFGVEPRRIEKWLQAKPEFREAVRRGRDTFDTEHVERSLLERAIGYDATDRIYEYDIVYAAPGQPELEIDFITGEMVPKRVKRLVKETVKRVHDTTAAIFWLKNRDRERWRDRQEVEHSGLGDLAQKLLEARKRVAGSQEAKS